jgi:hypothetical protein
MQDTSWMRKQNSKNRDESWECQWSVLMSMFLTLILFCGKDHEQDQDHEYEDEEWGTIAGENRIGHLPGLG